MSAPLRPTSVYFPVDVMKLVDRLLGNIRNMFHETH